MSRHWLLNGMRRGRTANAVGVALFLTLMAVLVLSAVLGLTSLPA